MLAAIGNPPGNTRTYLLHHDGFKHPTTAQKAAAHPRPGVRARLAGPIAMVQTDLLPYVGEGSNGVAGRGPRRRRRTLEIATASIGSPPYLLNANGSVVLRQRPAGTT